MTFDRRNFLYFLGASIGAVTFGACQASRENTSTATVDSYQEVNTEVAQNQAAIQLPPLPYAYDALQPHIDARTMRFHHDNHHATYVKNLNAALEKHPELKGRSIEQILRNIDNVPEGIRTTVRNNGGGHVNHSMFWQIMSPNGGGNPTGEIGKAIAKEFGSFAQFQQQFNDAGTKHFGSGWVWLVRTSDGKIEVTSTPNQDSPITSGHFPIMGNDVWEHAYYLKYRNRRADYLDAWWQVVNWDAVSRRYEAEKGR